MTIEEQTKLTLGYIRLTREESRLKNLSAPAQRQDIAEYVKRLGITNFRIIEEPKAVGGDVPFEKRPAGRELFELCKSGKVDNLVARDIDRFTRDVRLWLQLSECCDQHDIHLHTLSGLVPNRRPTDRFQTLVVAGVAQLEKEQTGERITKAKRQTAKQGRPVGGPPPFGYTSQARYRGELVAQGMEENEARNQAAIKYPKTGCFYIDEHEAETVKQMYHLYVDEGFGTRRISNEMNRLGRRRRSGLLFHPAKVNKVLSDPIVAGFIPYDEEFYKKGRGPRARKSDQTFYPGQHEALISEATFRAAQDIRISNRSPSFKRGDASRSSRRYAFAGIIECQCGSTMRSASTHRARDVGNYKCKKRFKYGKEAVGGCDRPTIAIAKADAIILQGIGEIVRSSQLVDQVFEAAKRITDNIARRPIVDTDIEAEIRLLSKRIKQMEERILRASSDDESEQAFETQVAYRKRRRELESELAKQPKAALAETPLSISKAMIAKHLDDLHTLTKRAGDNGVALVQSLVEHHGLACQLLDLTTVRIQLAFCPPGYSMDEAAEHAIRIEKIVEVPKNPVDTWLEEHVGTLNCTLCGELIEVKRQHYWTGLPTNHRACSIAEVSRRRANPGGGFVTGQQAADLLGISRTEFGRWMKRGKVTAVEKRSGVWLFDETAIRALAADVKKDRIEPDDGHLKSGDVAKRFGVSRRVVNRWVKDGLLKPVVRKQSLCLFRLSDVEQFEKTHDFKPQKPPKKLTSNGESLTIAEWSERLGLHKDTISRRLKSGSTDEEALRPVTTARLLTLNKESRTVIEWSEKLGIGTDTIYYRLSTGCTDDEALKPVRQD